ncbi:MAG: TadG family pilus assembly protein [Thermodesulfobacteriota bacterium]|nr:MAG: TadG family pilus assembly protein [Thermodesulfobacteriota bacterium]
MKQLKGPKFKNEHGLTALFVTLLLPFIFAFVGFAIDLGHLYVVGNELHKAADAGALAGARFLLNADGTAVNTGCNQIAYNAAVANMSEKLPVEVWNGDVQRGHWSFATRTFTPNDSTVMVDIWGKSFEELDADTAFINAVRVETRRETNQALSFFVRVFNPDFHGFTVRKSAVAYLGFAGTLNPNEVDQPIAICKQSITDAEGNYNCNIGRMLNSGSNTASHNTAGWTNFFQPCQTASTSTLRPILQNCNDGNQYKITLGEEIGTTGGVEDNVINSPTQPNIMNCWKNGLYDSNGDGVKESPIDTDGDGWPDQPWNITLPVIDCPGNNVSPCSEVRGAVNLNIIWILEKDNKIDDDAPRKMSAWSNNAPSGQVRWDSFVANFNLKNVDGAPAPFAKKSIYFLPDCTLHEPEGGTGGDNFGIRAKIPVLVE